MKEWGSLECPILTVARTSLWSRCGVAVLADLFPFWRKPIKAFADLDRRRSKSETTEAMNGRIRVHSRPSAAVRCDVRNKPNECYQYVWRIRVKNDHVWMYSTPIPSYILVDIVLFDLFSRWRWSEEYSTVTYYDTFLNSSLIDTPIEIMKYLRLVYLLYYSTQ